MSMEKMDSEVNATSCSVCREIYSDPRCLACGHSFCLKCLKRVAGNNQKFPCPICRFDVDLGYTNIDQLPKNFVLCNVIEALENKHASVCLRHNKSLDLFCQGCDEVICSKCLTMQHKGHSIEDIEIIFIERNKQYEAFLERTKHLVLMTKEKRDSVKQLRRSMEKNIDSISKTVANTFKKWNDALQKQHNAILSYLHQKRDQKRQVFFEAERILEGSMTTVIGLDNEISKLRSKDTAYVVQQYGFIKSRQKDTERKILQDIETCFTPTDNLELEVYAPWIEEAINNIKHIDKKHTQARSRRQKIAEIQEENFILKRECEKLRITLQELENSSEQLRTKHHNLKTANTTLYERHKEANSERERLRGKIKALEESLFNGKKDNKELQKKYNQREQELERKFNESKREWENYCEKVNEKYTKETEELHKAIKRLTVENDDLLTSLFNGKKDNKALQIKYNQLKQDLEREFNESKTEWENYCEKLNEKHTKETEELHNDIKRLTVEKENLLTRLTIIPSDRLTHVNIADLINAYHPTKLQEGYSELYDNEWTDAFEELTMHGNTTEYDAIIILLTILMSSFQNCREIIWGTYERLKNVASYIEQEIFLQSPKKRAKESVQSGEPNVSEASKDKSENKKGKPLHSLIETCLDMPFTVMPLTAKYLKRCIDLCWKMGVQQRPLYLDGVAEMDAYAGKKFDKDKFRAYTRSGSHIAFVVWPTLYLFEGGPILVKGLAQCCSPVETTNEKPS